MSRFQFLTLTALGVAFSLSSCCEPAKKDSQPVVVNSQFQQTFGYDLDLYSTNVQNGTIADSGYYPIYTFAIQNSGKDDDTFTLHLRNTASKGAIYGFDVSRFVPAGQTVLFRTPTPVFDSITQNETFSYPSLDINDTVPLMSYAYYGFFAPDTAAVKITNLRPTVTIGSGSIDNGPEACNTPATETPVQIDLLAR